MGSEEVVVFGDLNIDLLLRVDYIPTADIAISAKELRIRHGGVGGNIAVALRRLGINTTLIGAVGADIFGSQVISELRREGVSTKFIKRVNVPTGIMVVLIVPSGARSIVGFRGANKAIRLNDEEVDKALSGASFLHVSGYMALNDDGGESLFKLVRRANELGITVSIDLEGIAVERRDLVYSLKGLVNYVFLNKDELRYLSNTNNIDEGIDYLQRILNPKAIFLKLGPQGSMVAWRSGRKHIHAFRIRAVDSTGAGDAYNAGVIYSLYKGLSLNSAALIGNAMGAYACLGHGARYLPRSIDDLMNTFPDIREVLSFD